MKIIRVSFILLAILCSVGVVFGAWWHLFTIIICLLMIVVTDDSKEGNEKV
ncbi:MAG: hypothetical protein WCS17_01810 [Prevotella sp.]